jgi:hypothetical protein
MMKTFAVAALLIPFLSVVSYATTWIGTVTDRHCGPGFTSIRGDDSSCIVFIANDHQVYKVPDQEAVKPFVGKEVTIVGTVADELTIGVTYETQGILSIESIDVTRPLGASSEEFSAYQGWMKSLQPQVDAVRKAMGARDNATVAIESDKLAAILEQVVEFWRTHENADALQFATDASRLAKSVGTKTTQLDQTIALQKVQDTCAGCHLAHRTGKRDHYQIAK